MQHLLLQRRGAVGKTRISMLQMMTGDNVDKFLLGSRCCQVLVMMVVVCSGGSSGGVGGVGGGWW